MGYEGNVTCGSDGACALGADKSRHLRVTQGVLQVWGHARQKFMIHKSGERASIEGVTRGYGAPSSYKLAPGRYSALSIDILSGRVERSQHFTIWAGKRTVISV